MKYVVEMDSVAMIYIPVFIKIGLGIESCGGDSQIHREYCDLINLLLFFQYKESRLKI
jgi:hypothetical protein